MVSTLHSDTEPCVHQRSVDVLALSTSIGHPHLETPLILRQQKEVRAVGTRGDCQGLYCIHNMSEPW